MAPNTVLPGVLCAYRYNSAAAQISHFHVPREDIGPGPTAKGILGLLTTSCSRGQGSSSLPIALSNSRYKTRQQRSFTTDSIGTGLACCCWPPLHPRFLPALDTAAGLPRARQTPRRAVLQVSYATAWAFHGVHHDRTRPGTLPNCSEMFWGRAKD